MANRSRRPAARQPTFYSRSPGAAAGGTLSRDKLHSILWGAEPAYRAYLDANTGGATWSLKQIQGPTEFGETLVTWQTQPAAVEHGNTLTLYAIAVTEKFVEVRLFYNDAAGMPEQPRTKRVSADKLGNPGAVLAPLLTAYAGKVPWASENPEGERTRYDPAYDGPEALVERQRLDAQDAKMRRTHRWNGHAWVPRARKNPLDTSAAGWVHWHGEPPDDVGNLGPGQTAQTADGWWYRQDGGPDAGKVYFQASNQVDGGILAPVETVESIEYVETDAPALLFLPPETEGAGLASELARSNPLSRAPGLQTLPPVGARVRLTGKFLKNTGQHASSEGKKVWRVLGHSGDFVIVDEEADTSYFTPEEMAADPNLKWRRINRANLQIVGAPPRAEDLP